MIVKTGKHSEVVPLFTASTGQIAWYGLRLFVELTSGEGTGATVELKVNGDTIPDQTGAFVVQVSGDALAERQGSMFVRLEPGDAVTADVQGNGTVNFELSGDIPGEMLPES